MGVKVVIGKTVRMLHLLKVGAVDGEVDVVVDANIVKKTSFQTITFHK